MKKMMMAVFIIGVLAVSGTAARAAGWVMAAGQDNADFSGTWMVTWLDNNSRNPMVLHQNQDQLTGIYTSDDAERCSITGAYIKNRREISFFVKCSGWAVLMDGKPTADGKIIEGKYVAYGTSMGQFVMKKNDK